MLNQIEVLFYGALFALGLAGSIVGWYLSDERRRRIALRSAQRTAIREARAGEGEKLVGRVSSLAEPLRAPISGRPCVYYVAIVQKQQRQRGSEGSIEWVTLRRDARAVDFLLDDGTGRARVVGKEIRVLDEPKEIYCTGTFYRETPEIRAYLAPHGMRIKDARADEPIRCLEAVIAEGATAAVMGEVSFEVDPGGEGYREMPRRVVVGAPGGESILASADPHLVRGPERAPAPAGG